MVQKYTPLSHHMTSVMARSASGKGYQLIEMDYVTKELF